MNPVSDLIERFGGPSTFAEAIGLPDSHVRTIKTRKSIPSDYWPQVVAAAAARGFDDVTYEALTLMHVKKSRTGHPAEVSP